MKHVHHRMENDKMNEIKEYNEKEFESNLKDLEKVSKKLKE